MPGNRLKLTVPTADAGTRLDRFLAGPLGSRSAAQALIESGGVQVNGTARPKRHILQAGDVVAADTPAPGGPDAVEAEEPLADYAIAYEDEHLLIVDKPAGVVVHPARGHRTGTLSQALAGRSAGGDADRPGIVHRLDRETSGLLVVARTEAVHRALKSLLASRRLSREYVGLVDGHPPARSGTVDAPIGRDRRDRLRISLQTDSPRRAVTHFEVRERLPESALLGIRLETGRTHQIRVHLAAIGHPVSGDPLYGTAGRYGLARQFLHAERLAFAHPVTDRQVDVRSPLPDDLRRALDLARIQP